MTIKKDSWVEIEKIILTPLERAAQCPDDTKKTPYVLRISGLLDSDAQMGDTVRVKTLIGRTYEGKLITENPSYSHSFGKTVREILTIGTELEK